jgi:hypothetical protein
MKTKLRTLRRKLKKNKIFKEVKLERLTSSEEKKLLRLGDFDSLNDWMKISKKNERSPQN